MPLNISAFHLVLERRVSHLFFDKTFKVASEGDQITIICGLDIESEDKKTVGTGGSNVRRINVNATPQEVAAHVDDHDGHLYLNESGELCFPIAATPHSSF